MDHLQADAPGAAGRDQSSQIGSLGQVVADTFTTKSVVAVAEANWEELRWWSGGADCKVLEA